MSTDVTIKLNFAGREKELAQCRSLYSHRKHVLITGSPGIGKSALLKHLKWQFPILLCDDSSTLCRICDNLERHFGLTHSRLNLSGRKNRLLVHVIRRGQVVVFDHLSQASPSMAKFIVHLSERIPVWIVSRSELPHEVGQIWQYLSNFIRVQIPPLKKIETRILIAQAVSKRDVSSEALNHVSALYRISKGNPRHLEELLIELSSREFRVKASISRLPPSQRQ